MVTQWASKIPQDSPIFSKIPLSDLYAESSGGPCFLFLFLPRSPDPPLIERLKTLRPGRSGRACYTASAAENGDE